jgi:hypothetical protein
MNLERESKSRWPACRESHPETATAQRFSRNEGHLQFMNRNPLKQGALTENGAGIGAVTKEMVGKRAAELALINGRLAEDVSQSDWDQAKRELAGEPDMDPKDAQLESAPESERWDPVHGSTGHKVQDVPSEDEDDDGRSDSARLVEGGVQEAEHDQMLQAAKAQLQEDAT